MTGTKTAVIAAGAIIAATIVVFLALESDTSSEDIGSFEYRHGFSDKFNSTHIEKWCTDNNGIWMKDDNDCGFVTEKDGQLARIAFDELLNPQISQEKTQRICKFLEMECPSHASFTGSFDVMTGETFVNYEYKDTSYKFDVTSDLIKYIVKEDGGNSEWTDISSPHIPPTSHTAIESDESDELLDVDSKLKSDRELSISTRETFYLSGELIEISGALWYADKTNPDPEDAHVTIQIHNNDELIEVAQIEISSNGNFAHLINASGPQWQQSGRYSVTASLDADTVAKTTFGFSTYYDHTSDIFSANHPDSGNYEELCGYPVTDEMRLEIIKNSWVSYGIPYLTSQKGTFTHVERSMYLTEIPDLQYWFVLESGRQVYFEIGACDIDDSDISLSKKGLDYTKPQDIVVDGVHYVELAAPGNPLIYKDTLLPLLTVDNCKRVAENYSQREDEEMFTRDNTFFDPAWKNQIFPLMDYCMGIGNYELVTLDGDISWSFTEK